MRVAALHIYPLKSAAGLTLERWPLVPSGLLGDRRFMLVDPNGDFVSLRGTPRMVTIQAELDAYGRVRFSAPDAGELVVHSTGDGAGADVDVQLWGEYHGAEHVSSEADGWFSGILGKPVRLVRFAERRFRQVDQRYARAGDGVHFADGFPLLVTATASLAMLAEHLGRDATARVPLSMSRFRPNLVVETEVPFIEDAWRRLRIGDIEIDLVKPCARCVAVNVEPVTGHTSREPLATLAKLRTRNGKVYFGQNAIHRGVGTLAVGDPVEVVGP